jgi:ABC-type microcin C transport system permease subunit YejE
MFCCHTVVEVIHAIYTLFVVVLFWSTLQKKTWLNRSFLVIYQFSEMFSGSENISLPVEAHK